jgi:hypothetical protein
MRRTGLTLAGARQLLADFFALAIVLTGPAELYDRALQLADAYGLPAAYDAQYLALTQLLGCDFWTDDQALVRSLARGLDSCAGSGATPGLSRCSWAYRLLCLPNSGGATSGRAE